LSPPESDALLDALWAHIEREDLRYQHRWRVGDLLLWTIAPPCTAATRSTTRRAA